MDLGAIDKRLLQRMLRDHKVSRKEFEKTVGQLPDLAEQIAPVSEEEGADLETVLLEQQALRQERIAWAVERHLNPPEPEPPPPIPDGDEPEL